MSREKEFESRVEGLKEEITSKDILISKLKDDIVKLEKSFKKEELKKHQKIESLEERIENASIELANNKIRINDLLTDNQNQINEFESIIESKENDIRDTKKKLDKFKQEKLNLLKIVQQLADLGNPSLEFTGTIEDLEYDYDNEEEDYDNKTCCQNANEFVNYDVNEERVDTTDVEEYEEGSTSLENISEAFETQEADELI